MPTVYDRAKLGEVTGGGSQISAQKADGSRGIEWVDIDVEPSNRRTVEGDIDKGLGFLERELIRPGAPRARPGARSWSASELASESKRPQHLGAGERRSGHGITAS